MLFLHKGLPHGVEAVKMLSLESATYVLRDMWPDRVRDAQAAHPFDHLDDLFVSDVLVRFHRFHRGEFLKGRSW